MKLATYTTKLSQNRDVPGMFACTFDYEIKNTTARAEYKGPLIPMTMWNEVCAFFEWTQKEYHSEAQVRLFLNPGEGQWAAWAFPQKGNTGMASVELPDTSPERTAQRAQFGEGWIPFGTVHHHCAAGAFQSSTDKENEVHQDGIHITLGKIGSKEYDMHARFYCARNGFEPDMSEFFDISDLVEQIPKWSHGFMRPTAEHDFAVWKMTQPPEKDQTFPEIWKTNYIIPPPTKYEIITKANGQYDGGLGYKPTVYDPRAGYNQKYDLDKATRFLFDMMRVDKTLRLEDQSCEVTPLPLLTHLEAVLNTMAAQEAAEDAKASKSNGKKGKHHHKNKETPLLTEGGFPPGEREDWSHLV